MLLWNLSHNLTPRAFSVFCITHLIRGDGPRCGHLMLLPSCGDQIAGAKEGSTLGLYFVHSRALRAAALSRLSGSTMFVCLPTSPTPRKGKGNKSRAVGFERRGVAVVNSSCGLLRYERPPVCLRGAESRRSRAGELRVPAPGPTPEPPPGADDGDPGVPAADGELPPYHGTSLGATTPRPE